MDHGSNDFILKNVSEDLIDMYLDSCITAAGMCACPRCRADVRAFALNNFPPRYVVTDIGDVLSRVDLLSNQFRADIIIAIMSGINLVMRSPRHHQTMQALNMEAVLALLDQISEAYRRMDAMAEASDWDGLVIEWQNLYPKILELRQIPLSSLMGETRAQVARQIAELVEFQERISARILPWMDRVQPLLEVFRKYPVNTSVPNP